MIRRGFLLAVTLVLAACGRDLPPRQTRTAEAPAAAQAAPPAPQPAARPADTETLADRLAAIDSAVRAWRTAGDLATARRNAETARNLVVGPAGPFYGDADGDGRVSGASAAGLLPGRSGEAGIAGGATNNCVERDVLGGSWADPPHRWRILESAIARWAPGNNTFPKLPSHPQRVAGWATLTMTAPDLATARDYAGHARLHVDISKRALQCASR